MFNILSCEAVFSDHCSVDRVQSAVSFIAFQQPQQRCIIEDFTPDRKIMILVNYYLSPYLFRI